jgi:hypothetical protein
VRPAIATPARRLVRRLALGGLALVATLAGAADPPTVLFDCRADVDALRARLRAGGGDPAKIRRPKSADDLRVLETGKRYKFVVTRDGDLVVAPVPAPPTNDLYAHAILADGRPVRTAGGIRVERSGDRVTKVAIDRDSMSYCPTEASLRDGAAALAALGVARDLVAIEDRVPDCLPPRGAR